MNVLLSIFVGLGAGVGLAYFIEYLDTSIKTADDVERMLGLPVLGLIPQKVRPLIEEGPDSEHAEAYRVLRTNLAFTEGGSHSGAFCVFSGGAGEGKSTTVFNLAYVCAQQGEKVLLIDADLRRPVQHTILGVSNRFGLTNVLLRDVPVEEAIKATSVPNLHFLPSGRLPRSSLGVLDPKRIGELIASLKTKYDVVLIDTPPLVGISDSSIMAKEADGAILVVQYRKYPRDMLTKAREMMETSGREDRGCGAEQHQRDARRLLLLLPLLLFGLLPQLAERGVGRQCLNLWFASMKWIGHETLFALFCFFGCNPAARGCVIQPVNAPLDAVPVADWRLRPLRVASPCTEGSLRSAPMC